MSGTHTGPAPTRPEEIDDSYVSRPGHKDEEVPVISDSDPVEDTGIDAATADSDQQLEQDEKEAIDTSNIIKERTRHAKPEGEYREPGDEEGLPTDDGTSAGA